MVEHHLKPHLGHLPISKLTTADVDDFYGHLLSRGGPRGTPLAPATVARIHGGLHRAFAQAVRWEWVWINPVSDASPPRTPPPEICQPTIDGVNGPELRPTKTHMPDRVAVERNTLAVFVDHWRDASTRATAVGEQVTVSGLVFSHDPTGAQPWPPNWSPSSSSTVAGPA